MSEISGSSSLDVSGDFLNTFYFSQGKDLWQRGCYGMLAYQYDRLNLFPGQDMSYTAARILAKTCKNMRLPPSHADLSNYGEEKDSPEITSFKQFEKQISLFTQTLAVGPPDRSDYEKLVTKSTRMLIGMDLFYVQKGRPGNRRDPHESIYRQTVLKGRKLASVAFNAILADMRKNRSRHEDMGYLNALVENWEKTHPGKSFYEIEKGHRNNT
jgi:hypothetical protein